MPEQQPKPYTNALKRLMAEKSRILSKAQAFSEIGLSETSEPLWQAAALHEERIAPLLESLERHAEAAVHRISAASCYEKSGELSRAANLYRAALAGPLTEDVRQDIQKRLSACLERLDREVTESDRPASAAAGTSRN